MADGPKIATTPLELLSGRARETPLLSKLFSPVAWGTLGFLGCLVSNWGARKPVLSGIQKHIIITAGFTTFGYYFDEYRKKYLADRDAVLRHYVELHPEDFPPFERIKLKDVLEPWTPIR